MHEEFLNLCVNNEVADFFKGDRFEIYKFTEKPHQHILTDKQYKAYKDHLEKIQSQSQTSAI